VQIGPNGVLEKINSSPEVTFPPIRQSLFFWGNLQQYGLSMTYPSIQPKEEE